MKWFSALMKPEPPMESDDAHQRMKSDPDIMAESTLAAGGESIAALKQGVLMIPQDHVLLNVINHTHHASWATAAL